MEQSTDNGNSPSKTSLSELAPVIETLARTPRLLVATDFDGTISQITDIPSEAQVDPVAFTALRALAELPNTVACIISGRSLTDLRMKLPGLERVRLIGSHGSEFDTGLAKPLTEQQRGLLHHAVTLVHRAASGCPGAIVEEKPHSVVFHYRRAPQLGTLAAESLKLELSALGAGYVRDGAMLVEFLVLDANKGGALTATRRTHAPTMTIFIGDDTTDEDAFRTGDNQLVTIKVGAEATAASYRIKDVHEVTQLLATLAEERKRWLAEAPVTPIDRLIFLSDLRCFGLVDDHARLVWLSFPRLDSPPIFAELVGGHGAGSFGIRPASGPPPRQRYRAETLLAESEWDSIKVTDFLDCSGGRSFQRAGRSELVRIIEGSGDVVIEFAPRVDFGRVPTRLTAVEGGVKVDVGGCPMYLHAPGWQWEVVRDGMHDTALGRRELKKEKVTVCLCLGIPTLGKGTLPCDRFEHETERFWSLWHKTIKLPSVRPDLVSRSALVLRGLCYGPTGAIAAAATTSLPEGIGGIRNWDYRFCWPRDASLSATALARLGVPGPGVRLVDWLLGIVEDAGESEFLRPLYPVSGRTMPSEGEVTEAVGYRGSRPVRTGNLAAHQLQLDVLGPIAELLSVLADHGVALSAEHYSLMDRMVKQVELRWHEPDCGIWEIRSFPRHYVHSKLMCWYTVSQCIAAAEHLGNSRPEWDDLAAEIRADIETKGFSTAKGSYVAAYDLEEADAALFWIILTRFHEPNHPRIRSTLAFLEQQLLRKDSVYRYIFDDGLPGKEGSWHICLAWLIESLAIIGDTARARELFDKMCSRIGPLGLMPEQWDPEVGEALGNYPQAYSHVGLINTALALSVS